jgi:tungstate transport system ATP-binding protein
MTSAVLKATGMEVRRADRIVATGCNLEIAGGEVVGLYGPNGAGKSTLLEALAGLLPLSAGEIRFHGQLVGRDLPLLQYRRRMGAVFQQPLLLHGTVWQNVAVGLKLRGLDRNEQLRRANPWLQRLAITHVADRPAHSLSGGEAQRTSLARALVLDPDLLFLDEPFASLDVPTRSRLAADLADILAERHMATLFVTHDLTEVFELCHRCVVVDHGRVLQQGPPASIIHEPQCRRVAEITGAANLFQATVAANDSSGTRLDWNGYRMLAPKCPHPQGSNVAFMIQQDDIHLAAGPPNAANRIDVTVQRIREQQRGYRVSARDDHGEEITFFVSSPADMAAGERVALSFQPEAVWVLPQGPAPPEA